MVIMTHTDYMKAQADEIRKHKWIESEKAGLDLGEQACLEWVRKYARNFRESFSQKDIEIEFCKSRNLQDS